MRPRSRYGARRPVSLLSLSSLADAEPLTRKVADGMAVLEEPGWAIRDSPLAKPKRAAQRQISQRNRRAFVKRGSLNLNLFLIPLHHI